MTPRPRLAAIAGLGLAGFVALAPAGVTPASQLVTPSASDSSASHSSASVRHGAAWVASWAAMPQLTEPSNMPPAPYTQSASVLTDTTLRQTVHVTIGGSRLRLRFSNAFGGAPLQLTKVAVALPAGGAAGVSGVRPGTTHRVTFGGRPSVVVPTGALMVSDPVDLRVPPLSNLTITAYLAKGQASTAITSHPGSRTTSYLAHGDQVGASDLTAATPVDHWYFISDLEILEPTRASAVDVIGDSLTDGRGSTTNRNDRWPDQLAARLQAHRSTADVGVINEAAGGNRVLNDGLGPNALARFDRDVLAQSGVDAVIVFEGVNDIGTADARPRGQQAVTADLIQAYQQMILRAHAQGIRAYGATITPFGGNTMYDDPQGLRERSREAVNAWIRHSRAFDAVIDFDRAARDPQDPTRLRPSYDVGDHLHMNPQGYAALAAAVPLSLFP
jgi:lysophospholipase L1-like esterase